VKIAIKKIIFEKKSFMDYKVFHRLSYGLYIIATEFEGEKAGYIANTVFQVTSSPPLIAISCHKDNHTLQYLIKSRIFTVSVLKKETPASLIGEFGFMSGKEVDKFAHAKTEPKVTGAPVVNNSSLAWLDCRVQETLDLGTHMLLIAEVVDCGFLSDDEPLTYAYYREKFKMFSPKNAPTYIEQDKLRSNETEIPVSTKTIPEKESSEETEPYICMICGHMYQPEEGDPGIGIPPGTPFSDLPDDYRCPICNAGKDYFKPLM
jgi:flavin reductase (DIM6/NTAB) family NADH-FMN oxidoreductase RutF/rubredoxin